MSAITQAVRNFKSIWHNGDDDEYTPDEAEAPPGAAPTSPGYSSGPARPEKYSDNYAPADYTPSTYGGGGTSGAGARRLRPVPTPLRPREKNIYTLKPTILEEASIAADYLKTGSAVVLNLDSLDRLNSLRIIDFMSGVCYGLDGGHAMQLGETIFLFTPQDFEISSDETDYGENPDFFFKDVPPVVAPGPAGPEAQGGPGLAPTYQSLQGGERRSWER